MTRRATLQHVLDFLGLDTRHVPTSLLHTVEQSDQRQVVDAIDNFPELCCIFPQLRGTFEAVNSIPRRSISKRSPRVCVAGGSGFIGRHLCSALRKRGYTVLAVDWKVSEHQHVSEYCDEFQLLDLRLLEDAVRATANCIHVYNLAADMGGMGFIESNESRLLFNNRRISENMVDACRQNKVERFFFASTACVYNINLQQDLTTCNLKEDDVYPAMPQGSYGREKLQAEELALQCAKDFGMDVRIARYHNVYGPLCTWKGGREKVIASLCRKAAGEVGTLEIWGNGEQTRSFLYIDDCIEGTLQLMFSDTATEPLNIGSDEMVTINSLAQMILRLNNLNNIVLCHQLEKPRGVEFRNSDNTKCFKTLNWKPKTSLETGLKLTNEWIRQQVIC